MGADLAAEEQFGPYLVYERLGVGGMATVHRALERGIEGFERIVALKRLLPHLAEDASFIKSFVREAKLASLLNHHNIVQIYELGRVGSEYFISMEHIDGRDVRRILRHSRKVSGPPSINVTVGLLIQLCDALDYAHAKVDEQGHPLKLVHRDISPSNLLVTQSGHLKVIDFGIAKAQSSQLRTQTGRVKGKLAYMAPEAISGKDLDARSDLWACGVIAHELLTARPLFARKNEYETLIKVQKGEITKPSTFNEGVPAELDTVVMKALARDPDERYADAAALREALVDVRRKHKLATGVRDVANWLHWAFNLEAPSSGFERATSQGGSTGGFDVAAAAASLAGMSFSSAVQTPTPKPRREDDDAVEIAWGGGEDQHSASHPIELDDVPDVSDKHLGVAARGAGTDDLADDIPPPEPTHGAPRAKRDTAPEKVAAPVLPFPLPLAPNRPGDSGVRSRKNTERGHVATPDPDRTSADQLPTPPTPARALSELDVEKRDTLPTLQAEKRDTLPTLPAEPALVRF
jgi:serine/threonine protein kinase